jgi:hypothetical protein
MSQLPPVPASAPKRMGLYLPLVGLVVIAVAWTALWFYGRSRVAETLDNILAREAAAGRQWACPDRSIGGYPFRIEMRCRQPSYRAFDPSGQPLRGQLQGLTAVATTAGSLTMAHVITEFEGPLRLQVAGNDEQRINWKVAQTSVRGSRDKLDRFSLSIEEPRLENPDGTSTALRAGKLELHVVASEAATYRLTATLDRAQIPPLDMLAGADAPLNFVLDGFLKPIETIDRKDWRKSVEAWRVANGQFDVSKFLIQKGQPRIEATGVLSLDNNRRPQGQLDARFFNADQLLRQFGLPGGNLGNLLGGLLGGQRTNPQTGQTTERSMRLPLSLQNGRVNVGPFTIPNLYLPRLY